eukprot:scaffold925_cov133-Isochrysis_galbana.AAC.7
MNAIRTGTVKRFGHAAPKAGQMEQRQLSRHVEGKEINKKTKEGGEARSASSHLQREIDGADLGTHSSPVRIADCLCRSARIA